VSNEGRVRVVVDEGATRSTEVGALCAAGRGRCHQVKTPTWAASATPSSVMLAATRGWPPTDGGSCNETDRYGAVSAHVATGLSGHPRCSPSRAWAWKRDMSRRQREAAPQTLVRAREGARQRVKETRELTMIGGHGEAPGPSRGLTHPRPVRGLRGDPRDSPTTRTAATMRAPPNGSPAARVRRRAAQRRPKHPSSRRMARRARAPTVLVLRP